MSCNVIIMLSQPRLGSIPSVFDIPPRVGERITLNHDQEPLSGRVTSVEHTQDFTGAFRAIVYVELD